MDIIFQQLVRCLRSVVRTGSGDSKDSDNLRLRLAALARQAIVFLLLPPTTTLLLEILLYNVQIFNIIAQGHAWMFSYSRQIWETPMVESILQRARSCI